MTYNRINAFENNGDESTSDGADDHERGEATGGSV